ncbi:hypothetical protein BDV25DRAFT_135827 [Aspergillus avenaceus]|uniref:Cyanovirin-N domain-containing protein n=1 Tax=Aspergillus avenaceus TaxID=36643 RepID=A0A5N6U8F4_ASPAV|nr:hypothetical protein BDV25DRAFT_135827 [Aspergillus avenaceus]
MSQRKLKHTPHLRATCKRKDGLATEKTTLLELNLCLGWNKKTETLYRQMNGQGLARGACWGCRYQALGGSGPRFGCYCAEVSNPVEVPGSDEEGAWVQFDLDSAVDVSNNGRLKCRTPQVGTKNKAAL